jgi:hypothetical protein
MERAEGTKKGKIEKEEKKKVANEERDRERENLISDIAN